MIPHFLREIIKAFDCSGADAGPFTQDLELKFQSKLDISRCETLLDIVELVMESTGLERSKVWPEVKRITADHVGVRESELNEELRLVEDLGY